MAKMKLNHIRMQALKYWLSQSGRSFKITDNMSNSYECEWQDPAYELGNNSISIFCSIREFAAHITDHLRDYRYDKYSFNQSDAVN